MKTAPRIKKAKFLFLAMLIIGLSNFQPTIKALFVFLIEPFFCSLQYATISGQFHDEEMPVKHRTYESVVFRFEHHRRAYPADSVLYRLYRINPFLFWRWSDFRSSPRYQLPYLNPEIIDASNQKISPSREKNRYLPSLVMKGQNS